LWLGVNRAQIDENGTLSPLIWNRPWPLTLVAFMMAASWQIFISATHMTAINTLPTNYGG
jgi:hypothetical protein